MVAATAQAGARGRSADHVLLLEDVTVTTPEQI